MSTVGSTPGRGARLIASWKREFRTDSGSMTLQGGYDDAADARWSKDFPLTAEQSTALCRLVIDAVAASDPAAEQVAPGSFEAWSNEQ